jgi:hypothetical protein
LIAERHHPNRMTTRRIGFTASQKLLCHSPGMLTRTAAETRQRDLKHGRVSHRGVEPCRAFFHFADNHVRPVGGAAKNRIRRPGVIAERLPSMPPNNIVTRACETKCQDIEVGHSSRVVATVRFQHRILRDGEVPVDVQICLDQRH